MGSASDRARELVGAIDGALAPWIGSEVVPPLYPEEAKRATSADLRYLRRVLRATARAQRIFEAEMHRAFDQLGDRVAKAWRALKQGDEITVEMIIRDSDLPGFRDGALVRPFEKLYGLVGEITYGAVSERIGVDVAWNLEDPQARAVIAAGGRRLGLVDLADSTRVALFQAIHEGRSEGLGPIDLARRIRQYVPAGRFVGLEAERAGRGVAYRAQLIARTETTYARNLSALAAGTRAGFEDYLVFDARLGPTDAECEEIDGAVVSADEAEQLLDDEHPNGTRSVSPVPRT